MFYFQSEHEIAHSSSEEEILHTTQETGQKMMLFFMGLLKHKIDYLQIPSNMPKF